MPLCRELVEIHIGVFNKRKASDLILEVGDVLGIEML